MPDIIQADAGIAHAVNRIHRDHVEAGAHLHVRRQERGVAHRHVAHVAALHAAPMVHTGHAAMPGVTHAVVT